MGRDIRSVLHNPPVAVLDQMGNAVPACPLKREGQARARRPGLPYSPMAAIKISSAQAAYNSKIKLRN